MSLDIHRRLRCEHVLAAVEMRAESDTLLLHFSTRGKAEHLIAAAVCQDGLLPSYEPVKTAETPDPLGSRPQIEMIGIGEKDLGTEAFEIALGKSLDSALSAHGHERWCLDGAMRRLQHTTPRGTQGVCDAETE
jgi:hypothetical protein